MAKKVIIAIIISILLISGIIYYTERQTEKTENNIEEKEFYARADLKYIEPKAETANIYYMWMKGCPVCASLDNWFQEIKNNYNIRIYKFDIAQEHALFGEILEAYNVPMEKRGYVPFVFISDEYFIGFNQKIGEDMERKIKECLELNQCINPYDKLEK